MRGGIFGVALAAAVSASGGDVPLITENTLQHFVGDKSNWSFQNGVLTGKNEAAVQDARFLLSAERFGDFYLRFSARCAGATCGILFRGTIQPPFQVTGYQAEIGGAAGGSLMFRRPGRFNLAAMKAEPAEELSVASASAGTGADSWSQYEISALRDRLIVKVNGRTTAEFIENRGFREGMIGFRLGPGGPAKVEFKDLRINLLGEIDRKDSVKWAEDTRELLQMLKSWSGFQPLFDGNSLSGWRDTSRFWSARNGLIEGQPHNSFLVTQKEYANFILKASVRLAPADGNSGIQIRSEIIPQGMRGYQVDIGDPWWGQLYAESTQRGILIGVDDRRKRAELVRSEDWNDFVIICRNDHIIALLNGAVTADLIDYYGEKTGRIGLQIHVGPPMKIEFRNVRIKTLP